MSDDGRGQNSPILPVLLSVVLLLNTFSSGFSHMTGTTRIAYALARDGGLPGGTWLSYIDPVTRNPDRCIMLVFLMDASLALIPLVNYPAFLAITASQTFFYQMTYLVPISLFFLTLCFRSDSISKGEYTLGRWSIPCAFVSIVFLIITNIVLFFPQMAGDHILDNFNYLPIIFAATLMVMLIVWYLPEGLGGVRHTMVVPSHIVRGE